MIELETSGQSAAQRAERGTALVARLGENLALP